MTEGHKSAKEKLNISLPIPAYRMEIDVNQSGSAAVINGVIGVVEMSESLIRIMAKYGSVTVCGSRLDIAVFEYKTLQISGKIESISFSQKSDRRRKCDDKL